jgi:hypothetical protein
MGKVYHKERLAGLDVAFTRLIEVWAEELIHSVQIYICECHNNSLDNKRMDAVPMFGGQPVLREEDENWPIAEVRYEVMAEIAERLGFVAGHHQEPRNSKHFELR